MCVILSKDRRQSPEVYCNVQIAELVIESRVKKECMGYIFGSRLLE